MGSKAVEKKKLSFRQAESISGSGIR